MFRIVAPARKHGVDDADLVHAARNAMRRIDGDEGITMLLGPDRSGRLLEVGILDVDDDPVIIHGMVMRPKFETYL